MNFFSFSMEILFVLVVGTVTVFAWRIGREERLEEERGWSFIETGLLLLLLGAVVDVSDHFPELSRFVILGRTPYQAFVEKVVGQLGGFLVLTIGLWLWLPHIAARRRVEEELRSSQEELEERVKERTAELSNKTRQLQREVWQRERAQQHLRSAIAVAEEANLSKSRFLANMSHELRSPLNSVIGFANILLKNQAGNLTSQQLRYLDRVRVNGEHLLEVINELLDLAKVESGRAEVSLAPVNVRDLVKETVALLKGQLRDRSVLLQAVLPKRDGHLETDEVKLRQILINLISNAVKFTEEGEVTVRLWAREDGRPLRVTVTDTGIGIPEDRLETIFEAFRQLDSGPSRSHGGTGLGLSISRSLCELLGFELKVESEVGVGSTFSVVFQEDEPAAGTVAPGRSRTGRVQEVEIVRDTRELEMLREVVKDKRALIIDDSLEARLLLAGMVTHLGFEAESVGSGPEGLKAVRQRRPDLILLDLQMPSMDGWEVLANLRSDPALEDVPVVVVTVHGEDQRGSILGALEVLRKPVYLERLQEVVERCADDPRLILVVEDQEDDRQLLMHHLANLGLHGKAARSASEALEMMAQEAPDLLLVDLVLPGMDGIAFLQAVRRDPRYRGLPVVVITARDLRSQQMMLGEQGISAMLQKGEVLQEALQDAVREIFSG